MSRRHKKHLPGWFPFALTASFIIAVAAGIRSQGKLSGETPKPPPPPTPPAPGALQDWFGSAGRQSLSSS